MISLDDKMELLKLAHERETCGYRTTISFHKSIDINIYPYSLASAGRFFMSVRIEDGEVDPTYGLYTDFGTKQIQVGKASMELAKKLLQYRHFDTDSIIAFLKTHGCRKVKNYE